MNENFEAKQNEYLQHFMVLLSYYRSIRDLDPTRYRRLPRELRALTEQPNPTQALSLPQLRWYQDRDLLPYGFSTPKEEDLDAWGSEIERLQALRSSRPLTYARSPMILRCISSSSIARLNAADLSALQTIGALPHTDPYLDRELRGIWTSDREYWKKHANAVEGDQLRLSPMGQRIAVHPARQWLEADWQARHARIAGQEAMSPKQLRDLAASIGTLGALMTIRKPQWLVYEEAWPLPD